jgi:cytochrome c5
MRRPIAIVFLAAVSASPAAEHPGKAIYQKLCVECHGKDGQGVEDKFDEALTGELTLAALARKIDKTMPEDNAEACVGEDAKQVAAYMFDAFYSPEAQARMHPATIQLSRLTVPQFRASVMDVVGHFPLPQGKPRTIERGEPGLQASYRGVALPLPGEIAVDTTAKKGIKKKRPNKTIERVEPGVNLHFGADSPEPLVLEAEQFQTRFEGNVFAPDTGAYEFLVKTENGVRLWINDDHQDNALIDGWVSAGPQVREERKTTYLVGGRAYHLVLEHFKFKEKSASIELWWKPPHGVLEPIPQRVLATSKMPERMIVSTSFPADDRSSGYERGTTISKAWEQAVTDASIATAEYVMARVDRLANTKLGAADRSDKVKAFAAAFVATAFRRPLSEEQRVSHVDAIFASARSLEVGVKRVVLMTLASPLFLYPELNGGEPSHDHKVAARLALALWDSVPDDTLSIAATAGALHTQDQVRAQAERMMSDDKTKTKLGGFFHHWLDLERAEATSKDPKAFPDFNEAMLADLRESLQLFIDQVVWGPESDYRQLLRSSDLLLNERLAKYYGRQVKGSEFQRIAFDPSGRVGIQQTDIAHSSRCLPD